MEISTNFCGVQRNGKKKKKRYQNISISYNIFGIVLKKGLFSKQIPKKKKKLFSKTTSSANWEATETPWEVDAQYLSSSINGDG